MNFFLRVVNSQHNTLTREKEKLIKEFYYSELIEKRERMSANCEFLPLGDSLLLLRYTT